MKSINYQTRDVVAAAIFTALLAPGLKAATIIDFNDGTAGSDVGTFYSSLGATFSNAEWSSLSTGYTPAPDSTGLRVVGDNGNLRPTIGNPIVIVFSTPMISVSLIANSVNANGARLDLYDAVTDGNLVDFDQVVGTSGATNSNFTLSGTAAGILRAEFYQPLNAENEGVLIDNLMFTPVPEPSSFFLLSTAGWAILASRKRPIS
ncbi:PEP-CTERM sorting domain-containing protein [Roseibacillus ishigakijimensis]|uniref:PEP-CTERM sorting domain-containing protein n=1 Tax=Roseibacillus ishigakijimensis TaxID=454146 RepID=A0A934RRU4_9BACT|nr:PEP-CTERM sorting domain-containing protein [Roseibacillus ishigakijimensis]MBK1834762.1 PEP-CTERM sorting domain-containing protein [Roseibacillus ishigakijimensis]